MLSLLQSEDIIIIHILCYNVNMNDSIIVALIAGICSIIVGLLSIIGNYFITLKNKKESDIKDALREQKQSDRLDAIEHKLDIHNGYAEKLGSMSISMAQMQKDIEYLKKG